MRIALAVLLVTCAAAAQETAQPPAPGSDEFDWMQFKNGEWLKGEIKELQDDHFIFESDELDEVKLDFEDIDTVLSTNRHLVMLRDRSTLTGQLRITADSVTIITDEGEQTFPREDLRSIVPGEGMEIDYWSGKLSLGTTLLRGNTRQTDISGFVHIERRTPDTRLTLEYTGAWGSNDGDTTTNNHRALENFSVYLTERLYVVPARVVAFSDEFQNIEYRITPSVGVGYDLVETSKIDWTVGAGLGWEFTKFKDTPTGSPERQDSLAVLANTGVTWDVTSKIDLGLEFSVTMPLPETNDFNTRTALTGEFELYGDFDLDVRFTWDHNNNPATLANGTTPEQDDYRLYVGIGWSF